MESDYHELLAVWSATVLRLGNRKAKYLILTARKFFGKLKTLDRVKLETMVHDREGKNLTDELLTSQGGWLELVEAWRKEARAEAVAAARKIGASPSELTVAGWYYDYSRKEEGLDPAETDCIMMHLIASGQKLCLSNLRRRPYCQAQMQQHRYLLLQISQAAEEVETNRSQLVAEQSLHRTAEVLQLGDGLEQALNRAWRQLQADLIHMGCHDCASKLDRAHAFMWPAKVLPARAVLEIFQAMKRGTKEKIACRKLRYTKASIETVFEAGAQMGRPIQELVDILVSKSEPSVLESMCVVAVHFHGLIMVVDGNKRLWALREAEKVLREELSVWVDVQDLCLGSVHGQPALQTFWKSYTSTNEGASTDVAIDKNASELRLQVATGN